MLKVKHPNVAGTFYPRDPEMLKQAVRSYIQPGKAGKETHGKLSALIVPHAGYVYSGPVAGVGYYLLSQLPQKPASVAVLAPSHFYGFGKVATLQTDVYETPLGPLLIDKNTVQHLLDAELVSEMPEVFEQEHALEVQLPFIREVAPRATIIPLIVGQTRAEQVELIIDKLIKLDVFIIISTDLSHFHLYTEACEIDHHTKERIEALDYQSLNGNMACGFHPLAGLLKWTKANSGKLVTLDLRNSGDTAGDKSRVVGYGSFALYV
ncbi:AmmeMemoRadiSam system protein B [Maribellus mangrovi]|uniref:AmmeMemoRadiSam system protein B n=1 Tax=Maribellus mangrovi TaxID=3133146 RepID=UPI0030EF18CB